MSLSDVKESLKCVLLLTYTAYPCFHVPRFLIFPCIHSAQQQTRGTGLRFGANLLEILSRILQLLLVFSSAISYYAAPRTMVGKQVNATRVLLNTLSKRDDGDSPLSDFAVFALFAQGVCILVVGQISEMGGSRSQRIR